MIFILTLSFKNSLSQNNKFEDLSNEMFFNIFIHKPDSSILEFVNKYYPSYVSVTDSGGWTVYPPQKSYEEVFKAEHTFIFYKHPFFDFTFREGRLEFLSTETNDLFPRISRPTLCFSLNSKVDAEKLLLKFINIYRDFAKNKKVINDEEKRVVLLSKDSQFTRTNCIEIILLKDNLFKGNYKVLFRLGAFTYDKSYYKFNE